MTSEFASYWSELARFDAVAEETMRSGGYYAMSPLPGLRVISINTNYW